MAESPPPRVLSFSPVTERHKMFAYDMVFFIAKECNYLWTPYGYDNYSRDALSPMTSEFEEAARITLRSREESYRKAYQELVTLETRMNPNMFAEHARQMFRIGFDRSNAPGDFFCTVMYVARLGLMFYENGDHTTPSFAANEIGDAFLLYTNFHGPEFFTSLIAYVNQVIENNKATNRPA